MKLLQDASDLVKGTGWALAPSSSGHNVDDAASISSGPVKEPETQFRLEELNMTASPGKHERRRSLLFPNSHSFVNLSIIKSGHISCSHHVAENEPERSDKQAPIKRRVDQITSKLLSKGFILGLPTAWADYIGDDSHTDADSIRALSASQLHDLVNRELNILSLVFRLSQKLTTFIVCFEDPSG